jgi:hypothetical protein
VFAFFISGAKERNPAAAMALQERLGIAPPAGEADATTGKVKAPVKKAAAKKAPAKKK